MELTEEQINKLLGRKPGRPTPIKAVPFYERESDRHPERLRVVFDDDSEEIYIMQVKQPAPTFPEIRGRNGYLNQPMMRRRRKG